MNQSVWSKDVYASSSICLDGCSAEHLSSLHADPLPSNPDTSGVSVNLHKDGENMKTLQDSSYYSSRDGDSSLMCPNQLDGTTGHLSGRRHPSPAPASYEWNLSSGHQAKRARVENIIKGMTSSSPGIYYTDSTITNQHEETGCVQQDDPVRELPSLQERSMRQSQAARKQLERQHQHLRQLRTRFTQADGEITDSSKEGTYPSWNESDSDAFIDLCSDSESSSSRKYQGWKKAKLMNYYQSKPERIKLMADVLKYELSRAVSRSVDSIFKSMPLLQASPNDAENAESDVRSSVCRDDTLGLSCCGAADVQTEALSLVVQKPELERTNTFSRAHHLSKPPNPFSQDSALHENPASEKQNSTEHQLRFFQDGHNDIRQSKSEIFDTHWSSVKMRSKVNSRSVRSPHSHTMLLESLCLPQVKIESDNLVKNNLYMLNEGLTTNHLKKAKLMFFYTRYPSSLVLKMCFHDVQFTRCITSQLIKWFSNFREFYYIQMEKFARHALMEGLSDVRSLTVGRESELFRVLNMHYNKANDYQVPERFLEVAEVTLREFYVAISMGKDRDPSWKKAIYKVICKLDGDVPAEFKSHHTG